MRNPVAVLVFCGLLGPLGGQELKPFSLPWNDSTAGLTNLQNWQPDAIGPESRVTLTPDGHYSVNGQRIRFLGVNITAASPFPTAERAEGHAARLARFGFNAVRMHHMEAPWDKRNVLIDYAAGSSRELSAERLDRLQYFVAQLAARGIYTNLNLLVSREFQTTDGLGPEISQLGWKDQHILGFFSEAALDLHKEYATKLLSAPNPYRDSQSFAQDPAIAVVEIMNENGLLQKWHEGVLDRLPEVYKQQLSNRWNQWLKARYESTPAMLTAWGAVNEPLGADLLRNTQFQIGTQSWNIERHNGAVASASTPADFNGQPSLKLDVTTPGQANWHVQLNQSQIRLESGAVYTVSFWAKASSAVPLSAGVQRAHSDYAGLGAAINVTLARDWKQYTMTFQSGVTESNARLNFNGFGDRQATVWFADVHWQPGGRLGGVPEGASLEEGNLTPVLKQGGTPTAAQQLDWVRFVLATEREYWDTMYRHIKQTLGYPGLVWGTIISNSPPNTQAGLDAIDSHTYWQHPSFPAGQDFNTTTWSVNNVSMVNDANGGVLGGLSRQRVKGKPHNVTEYQHSAPNTYNSETALLSAAYGALQDWDGIWFFEYNTSTSEFTTGWFDHGGDPGKMANNLLAATMFRRGDVAPALNEFSMSFPPETEARLAATRGGAWSIADGSHLGVPASLALQSRLSLSLDAAGGSLDQAPAAPPAGRIESDTGELAWDRTRASQGVVTVNTARTKAVIGFRAKTDFDLGPVRISPGESLQNWSTIGITLLEGDAFDSPAAGSAVIVATGDHANTGMVFTDSSRTSVSNRWGGAPALIEAVKGTIDLPVTPDRVSVWALDPRGERLSQMEVTDFEGKARLTLGSAEPTLWYEVRIAAVPRPETTARKD